MNIVKRAILTVTAFLALGTTVGCMKPADQRGNGAPGNEPPVPAATGKKAAAPKAAPDFLTPTGDPKAATPKKDFLTPTDPAKDKAAAPNTDIKLGDTVIAKVTGGGKIVTAEKDIIAVIRGKEVVFYDATGYEADPKIPLRKAPLVEGGSVVGGGYEGKREIKSGDKVLATHITTVAGGVELENIQVDKGGRVVVARMADGTANVNIYDKAGDEAVPKKGARDTLPKGGALIFKGTDNVLTVEPLPGLGVGAKDAKELRKAFIDNATPVLLAKGTEITVNLGGPPPLLIGKDAKITMRVTGGYLRAEDRPKGDEIDAGFRALLVMVSPGTFMPAALSEASSVELQVMRVKGGKAVVAGSAQVGTDYSVGQVNGTELPRTAGQVTAFDRANAPGMSRVR